MIFWIIIALIVLQRLMELRIAKGNEVWIKEQGGYEVGQKHYPFIVALHVLFFISLIIEASISSFSLGSGWPLLLVIFIVTQALRVWSIVSLGRFWNTKIMILPQAHVQRRGPYRWLKHPNYVIVAIELLVIPLLFGAFVTAVVFTILNAILIGLVRIPAEEKALREATDYSEVFTK
ncbi:isoprenylcysteine carboxyl methyltransferase family protein [Bacillus horti]|uniref:Methyltransferase n=1 Tax=Caldalkalibacillus horti TaxID=77523 RepID=A0ABT9W296_9BACI|nr:isoprenylcysteine carboxylmethyltransferase family protein [Bacillus horti]MDQ0167376.1 methyltransferase [Bacillus horti]